MRALLIIVHYTAQIYIVQNCKKPMKAGETAVDIILYVSKNSHGNFCSDANMRFVNFSRLKLSPDFQNTQKESL